LNEDEELAGNVYLEVDYQKELDGESVLTFSVEKYIDSLEIDDFPVSYPVRFLPLRENLVMVMK